MFGAEPLVSVGERLNSAGKRSQLSVSSSTGFGTSLRLGSREGLYPIIIFLSSTRTSDRFALHKSNCSYGQTNGLEGACFVSCLHFGEAFPHEVVDMTQWTLAFLTYLLVFTKNFKWIKMSWKSSQAHSSMFCLFQGNINIEKPTP